uniref:SCAN box domain-containing protein n=1 Tax=Crocodylus porosus TaxID=8502 RepID=A0A7M4FVI7_CROPO
MTREDDPEAFLEIFERAALAAGLEKAKWAGQLGTLLIGQAQAAYRAISRTDAMDYDKVKGEILLRLDITPERRRQAFREREASEVRSPRILWQTLADLLARWLRPEVASKEQIVDQILMEQFINDLEEETRKWVRCHCPASSREALQWAEQFDAAQGERRKAKGERGTDLASRRVGEGRGNRKASAQGFSPVPVLPLPRVQAWVEGMPILAVVDTECLLAGRHAPGSWGWKAQRRSPARPPGRSGRGDLRPAGRRVLWLPCARNSGNCSGGTRRPEGRKEWGQLPSGSPGRRSIHSLLAGGKKSRRI